MKYLVCIIIIIPVFSVQAPTMRIELGTQRFSIPTEWDNLWFAISFLESRCNDDARNPTTDAVGRYQILKGMVREANRLKGAVLYKYGDRTDPSRAREIIDIVQDYYNPEQDLRKAIRIHAIGFSKDEYWLRYAGRYEEKVINIMDLINKYNTTR